jgi:hypothetical protein
MTKLYRSNLKFIRLVRKLQKDGMFQGVRVSVMGSTQCYIFVDIGDEYIPLGKDVHNIGQLAEILRKLGV